MNGLQRVAAYLLTAFVMFGVTAEVGARLALGYRPYLDKLAGSTEAGRKASALIVRPGTRLGALNGTGGFVYDPDVGWTGGPFNSPDIHTGPDNLRMTHPADAPPAADAPTISLFGDSFVFGLEVNDDQAFAWQLESRTGWNVRTYGSVGYGVDQAFLRWRKDVKDHPPDVVVLGYNIVGVTRSARKWDSWAKPWFELDATGTLQLRGVPVPRPETFVLQWWTPRLPMLLDVWRELAVRKRSMEGGGPVVDAIVHEMRREVEASGSVFVVAYLPILQEYEPGYYDDGSAEKLFASWCADGMNCVDLLPRFKELKAAGHTVTKGKHWTPEGHAVVAEGLEAVLGPLLAARAAAP